jgi:hypothetical protein
MAMTKGAYAVSPTGLAAADKLMKQGFEFPEQPGDGATLPDDLSDLDPRDLIETFALMTAWADYAHAQVGLATISEREAERVLEKAQARYWLDSPKGATVASLRTLSVLDPDVTKAQQDLDEHHAYRRLVSDLASRYERDAAVLSRELTRRTSENSPKSTRRERWGGA